MLSFNTLCIIPNVSKYGRALINRHLSKKTHNLEWKENLQYALENHHELYLRPLRVVNPRLGTSFSSAPIEHRRLKLADKDAILQTQFSTVFSRGFEDLKSYLCNDHYDVLETALWPLSALSVYLTELRMYQYCIIFSMNSMNFKDGIIINYLFGKVKMNRL